MKLSGITLRAESIKFPTLPRRELFARIKFETRLQSILLLLPYVGALTRGAHIVSRFQKPTLFLTPPRGDWI